MTESSSILVLWRGKWVTARRTGSSAYGWTLVVGLPGRTGAVAVPTELVRHHDSKSS